MVPYLSAWLALHVRNEKGATAIEYALLVVMVGLMAGVAFALRETLKWIFEQTLAANDATPGAPTP
jgi:Flp pilus assembly pilin Flp